MVALSIMCVMWSKSYWFYFLLMFNNPLTKCQDLTWNSWETTERTVFNTEKLLSCGGADFCFVFFFPVSCFICLFFFFMFSADIYAGKGSKSCDGTPNPGNNPAITDYWPSWDRRMETKQQFQSFNSNLIVLKMKNFSAVALGIYQVFNLQKCTWIFHLNIMFLNGSSGLQWYIKPILRLFHIIWTQKCDTEQTVGFHCDGKDYYAKTCDS